MNVTEQHILYILETRGIVNVPGLGVFVCRRHSAAFDGNSLAAPGTNIHFEHYAEADGCQLIASVARAENLSEEEARALIEQDVDMIITALNHSGSCDISEIGSLYVSHDGELEFEQSDYHGLEEWLPALKLHPLSSKDKAKEQIVTVDKHEREQFMRSLRRTASSAAAIAVFVLITFIVSQLPRYSTERQEAGFALDQIEQSTTLPTTAPQPAQDAALVLIFNTPADGVSDVSDTNTEAITDEVEQKESEGRYCLVVASLATRAEANKYIASNGGTLLEKDGRFRVYAESSDDYASLERMRTHYESSWICRR